MWGARTSAAGSGGWFLGAAGALVCACGSRTDLRDFAPPSCPASNPVYVVAVGPTPESHDVLLRFDPPSATFTAVGPIDCLGPGPRQSTVMAVDRSATAYVASSSIDTQLFRVANSSGSCSESGFRPSYTDFGLAFVGGSGGPANTLYAVETGDQFETIDLETIDLQTLARTPVGPLHLAGVAPGAGSSGPVLLAGTASGGLFLLGFGGLPPPPGRKSVTGPPPPAGPTIWRIDLESATETFAWQLPDAVPTSLQGFASWGGDFYLFASSAATTAVWRFRPADGSVVPVAAANIVVLAAAASTCASAP